MAGNRLRIYLQIYLRIYLQIYPTVLIERNDFVKISSYGKLLLAPLACGLLMAAHPAQAQSPNLVTNGGFETGDFTGWTLSGNQDGNTFVARSVNDFGNILLPHSGNYAAFLGAVGSDNFLTQQSIPTIVGDGYVFTYYLASDGQTPNDFTASFGGNTVFTQTNIPQQNYVQYSFTEVATSASTTIQFASRDDPGYQIGRKAPEFIHGDG